MSFQPSAVVFDLGKVLVDFDYSLVVHRIAAKSQSTPAQLQQLILESPLLPAYERGELSSEEFFERVRRETGFVGDYPEFSQCFADIFTEIPPMIALHAELQVRGVPTFIFSNTNDLAARHIRDRFPFFSNFNGYILSFEHGSMKPDAPLYEVVESVTGRKGSDLLYFDDRPENIETGRSRGWHAFVHAEPTVTRERVQDAGLIGDLPSSRAGDLPGRISGAENRR